MKHCPFCAETLELLTVFCPSCGLKLPIRLPDSKPSAGWRTFAARYPKLHPEDQAKAWSRLDRNQRSYAATQLGLQPPAGSPGRGALATVGSVAYLGLFLAALVVLANLTPSWPGDGPPDATPAVQAATELKAAPKPDHPTRLEEPSIEFLTVRARANIRGGPSLTAPVVGKALSGQRLEFLSQDGDWFLLTACDEYAEGYIHETVVQRVEERPSWP